MDKQNFKTNARIILEIGKESIESKIVALSEIVKNSYDAGAKNCQIIIKEDGNDISLLEKEISSIEIIDDGCGMTKEDLINNWLVIGTTSKRKIKNQNENLIRVPIGEKGIGRFAVNKLGNKITLITKKENDKCYKLEIDFNKFDTEELLENISFDIYEVNEEKLITQKQGTIIKIDELNEKWNYEELSKVYDEILKLQSPFNNETDEFNIEFITPSNYKFTDRLTAKEILNYSLWNCSIVIKPNESISDMNFSFTPYPQMKGFEKDNRPVKFKYEYNSKRTLNKINLDKFKIGEFKVQLFAFHRSSNILKMLGNKRNSFKEYLDENGGVRIYRGGQRIYNYGTKNEDWLDLNIKRLNSPGTKLSKNILIGIIELNPRESGDLIEKTNREGFIENEAFFEFKKIVSAIVDEFAFQMIPTKDKIKQIIDKNIKIEHIDTSFEELITEIEDARFENENEREKILFLTNKLMKDYEDSRKLYLSIANNSVDFHIVFHDIDKQIKGLINLFNNKNTEMEQVTKAIHNINDILNLQKDLISQRDFKTNNSEKILEKFSTYAKYRLLDHKINLVKEDEKIIFKCIESQILRMLINLFDNSVYWLSTKGDDKKVFIKFFMENEKVCILFADNGPGFGVEDPNILFKPFVTKKDEGLGLGLYIVNEIVNVHKGKISILEYSDIIPKEYTGAKFKIELEME